MSKPIRRRVFSFLSRWIAPGILRSLRLTNNYEVSSRKFLDNLTEANENFILSFWHGQMLPVLLYFTYSDIDHTNFYTFISPHRDGEYITQAARGLGINALRTSLRDRRIRAVGRAIKLAREGKNLAITPDGPLGPSFEVKEGIIRLSEKINVPILPVASLPSRCNVFSSWDHFLLPYPLSKIHTKFGKPFRPWQKEEPMENKTKDLQKTLNQLTRNLARNHVQFNSYLEYLPADTR